MCHIRIFSFFRLLVSHPSRAERIQLQMASLSSVIVRCLNVQWVAKLPGTRLSPPLCGWKTDETLIEVSDDSFNQKRNIPSAVSSNHIPRHSFSALIEQRKNGSLGDYELLRGTQPLTPRHASYLCKEQEFNNGLAPQLILASRCLWRVQRGSVALIVAHFWGS
jgi:hypothetical protein